MIQVDICNKVNGRYKLYKKGVNFTYSKVMVDLSEFYNRKVNGESITIQPIYNYYDEMDVAFYFNNGWKYIYRDIPCIRNGLVDFPKLWELARKEERE